MNSVILSPIILSGAMAIEGGSSCRSVSLWLSDVCHIVRSVDPTSMYHFHTPHSPSPATLRENWIRANVGALTPAMLATARDAVGKPAVWGPLFWQTLHNLSTFFDYKRTRDHLLQAFALLPFILPCRMCRVHAQENLARMRNVLRAATTRGEFVNAVVELHNFITRQLKPTHQRLLYPLPVEFPRRRLTVQTAQRLVEHHGRSSISGAPATNCGCDR